MEMSIYGVEVRPNGTIHLNPLTQSQFPKNGYLVYLSDGEVRVTVKRGDAETVLIVLTGKSWKSLLNRAKVKLRERLNPAA